VIFFIFLSYQKVASDYLSVCLTLACLFFFFFFSSLDSALLMLLLSLFPTSKVDSYVTVQGKN